MDSLSYQDKLTLTGFFDGPVVGEGVVTGRRGDIKRRFTGAFEGARADGGLAVSEALRFDDGEVNERDWLIREGCDGHYSVAPGHDTGAADIRTLDPTAGGWRWTYTMDIPVHGRSIAMKVVDLMLPLDRQTMVAHTTLAKFGIVMAHVYTSYSKN
ncbi:hypothetical protein CCR85_01710 [Rhodothalassium salexigens]|uniref:DUF3833 family protein n=1 Tax=Rhodothalassium salexigens TaxID=1086 RepID=UPI0019123663|nr:DUF3833 family protein [Rhodothalassium salexigens]MBK5910208.1 hypothetical protein [Rhodothalassium salexigens]MBK5920850.1 hypothetical protein [Rhodothalassium salexigens]